MGRCRAVPLVVFCVLLLVSSGCHKDFQPGRYAVTSAEEGSPDQSMFEQAEHLMTTGIAIYDFKPDGQFVLDWSDWAVGNDSRCSGTVFGNWAVAEDQLVMLVDRWRRLRPECRPEPEIVYTWQRDWQGKLKLEQPWVGDKTTVYWLTRSE